MDYLLVPDDDGEERSDEDEDAGDGMDGDEPALPRVALSAREAHPLPVAESRRVSLYLSHSVKRLADPSRTLTVSRAGREESGFARELLPWRRQLSRSSLQDHDSRAPNDLDHDHCRRRRLGQPRRTFPSLASADLANLSRQQSQKLLRPEHRQNSHTSQYKSDSKEESQGNGTTLGANSSVYVPSLGFLLSRADLHP